MSEQDNRSLLAATGKVKYRTILSDPPWPSKSSPGARKHWMRTNMKPRYNTMKAADIIGLPVHAIAHEDAMLVLWATWMHLALAMQVIEVWGFTYCTGMPWLKVCKPPNCPLHGPPPGADGCMRCCQNESVEIKPIYGPGVWFQGCTELILIARRGRPFGSLGNPRPARKGIVIAPRQEHSRKPEEVHLWLEGKFPGPKIELFARRNRPGWVCWGSEVGSEG